MEDTLFSSLQADLFAEPVTETEAKKDNSPDDVTTLRKRLNKILAKTDDFRILERIPLTRPGIDLPYSLSEKHWR